ncbi:hypothetical protein BC835DRAFT_1068777 [Cytidiella melzeri]|nr:hypothetical protein BC835DRAFT_1068777 [Cytidiella melzeri]
MKVYYKSLKKIISSLESNRPLAEAAALAVGTSGAESLGLPLLPSGLSSDDDNRGREFQAYKAAFFFKLERELEKINAFYLDKEAELQTRLETLLSKRRAAASRVLPTSLDSDATKNHVEWNAVEEGFHLLERDLGKLQVNRQRNPLCSKVDAVASNLSRLMLPAFVKS